MLFSVQLEAIQNLYESIPRIQAVLQKNGGSAPYLIKKYVFFTTVSMFLSITYV
jgi:hypothetical protein